MPRIYAEPVCQLTGTRYFVKVLEERQGSYVDDQGYTRLTHNTYAGIGVEVNPDTDFRTGRYIAWAGDGADGAVDVVEPDTDLDQYLGEWDQEWVELFETENIL